MINVDDKQDQLSNSEPEKILIGNKKIKDYSLIFDQTNQISFD